MKCKRIRRTGRMFACEHEGVEPDLLVRKSLGEDFLAAVVEGRGDGRARREPGRTYIGNPLACAAAHAVLTGSNRELLRPREAIA